MTKNDTRQCLINFIQENTYTFDEVQFSVPVPTFYAWVSYGVTCTWMSEFRLFLPYICLPETKKIHLVLYIRFCNVLSNVYDKTELLIMQPNKDGSPLLNHKLPQLSHTKKLL